MSTTNSGFFKLTNAVLTGLTVGAAGALAALNATSGAAPVSHGDATRLDAPNFDLSTLGLAKNGAARFTLTGTTPVNIDLTDLTTGAASSAGDTSFASFSFLILFNDGAASVTVAPGGSNPASIGLAGTTPTLAVGAGVKHGLAYATPVTVDSTHKVITVTPTAGGSFVLCVAGA